MFDNASNSLMIVNPEPNLRPFTTSRFPHGEDRFGQYHSKSCSHRRAHRPSSSRNIDRPGTTSSYYPNRNTGSCSVKATCHPYGQKSASGPQSTARSVSLPIISELPRDGFNSDDSDDDAASRAASAHDHTATDLSRDTTIPPTIATTTPPGTSTPLVLTPNPTIRILQPTESSRPPSDPPYRPWSNADDQELITLKMTRNPVLRGRRSVLGFVVILRYAN